MYIYSNHVSILIRSVYLMHIGNVYTTHIMNKLKGIFLMKLNGYKVVCEAMDTGHVSSAVVEIIENQLGKQITNLDGSLVNEYGANPEDIANIFLAIEEKLQVYLSQETKEKEVITPRFLIDSVIINLRDPQSKNRVISQVASHIEGSI